jgi:hypothetical protein
MKIFDNLSPLGIVIVIFGVIPFVVGCLLIVLQIPDTWAHFQVVSGTTSFDFNQMKELMLNPVAIGAFAWMGVGLGIVGIGAHFQKDDMVEEKSIEQ